MSAYIVDRDHIRYLVHAAQYWSSCGRLKPHDDEAARAVGQMLWDECIKSVSYRYPDEPRESLPGPIGEDFVYEHGRRDAWLRFDPVQVLKAIACFEYQSCEHPGWRESEAYGFCQALRSTAIAALPGYEDAPWGAP